MGTRLITDAARLSNRGDYLPGQPLRNSGARLKESLSGNFRLQIIYDGTPGQHGLSPDLLGNETWVDTTGLFRLGLSIGPTFQNTGSCTCTITGCNLPKDYAYNVNAARVAEAASLWSPVAVLTSGQVYPVGQMYSLMRFVFTPSGTDPGCIAVQTW